MLLKKKFPLVIISITIILFLIVTTFYFFDWKLPKFAVPTADDFMSSEVFYLTETSNGLYSTRNYTTVTSASDTTFTGEVHPFLPNYNLAFFDSYNDDLIWGSRGKALISIDGEEQTLPAGLETIFFTGNWRIAQMFDQDTTIFTNLDTDQEVSLPGQFTQLQVENFVYLMLTNPIHENPLYRLDLHTLEVTKIADFATTIDKTYFLFAGNVLFYLADQTMYQIDQSGTISIVRPQSELFDLLNDYTITPLSNKNNGVSSSYLVTNSQEVKLLKLYPNATYSLEVIPNLTLPPDMDILLRDVVIDPVSQNITILLTTSDEEKIVPYLITMDETQVIAQQYWPTADAKNISSGMKLVRINKMP